VVKLIHEKGRLNITEKLIDEKKYIELLNTNEE
jgi:hypothetical protein